MALSPYHNRHAIALYRAGQYEELYDYCKLYKKNSLAALTMFALACDVTGRIQERDLAYQDRLRFLQKKLNQGLDSGRTSYSIAAIYGTETIPLYDPVLEFQYLEKSYCSYGYSPALWEYIQHLIHGIGCSPAPERAVRLLQEAICTNPDFEVYLGIFYDYGVGLKQNRKQAFSLYQKHMACQDKVISETARLCLAICYYHGAGTCQNSEKALQLFQSVPENAIAELYISALSAKNADAFYHLGCAFLLGGIGCIQRDPPRGFAMIETAYTLSHREPSCSALGECYLTGRGCRQNFEKARQLLEEAGSDAAQVYLGVMAYNGLGQPVNDTKAMQAFQLGADQGNPVAVCFLAICYLEGNPVQQSHAEAKKILEKYPVRGYDLGSLHCRGLKALLALESPSSFDEKQEALHEIQLLAKLAQPWRSWRELLERDLSPESISRLIELFCKSVKRTFVSGDRDFQPFSIHTLFPILSSVPYGLSVAKDYAANNYTEKYTRNHLLMDKQNFDQRQENQKQLASIRQSLVRVESKLDVIQSHIIDFKQQTEKTLANLEALEEQELYISQTIQQTSELLYQDLCRQSAPNVSQARNRLQDQFGPCWDKLLPQSQNALVSASVLLQSCASIDDAHFDYSGICITATSALESELCKYFFTKLNRYLEKKYADKINPYQYWPDALLCRIHDTICPQKRFSIGLLPYLFAFNHKLVHNVKHLPPQEEKQLLQNVMQEYLSTILRVPDGINPCALFCESRGTTESFVARCETIREKYRNPAAHRGSITKKDADCCYCEIVGRAEATSDQETIEGLLMELLSLIR